MKSRQAVLGLSLVLLAACQQRHPATAPPLSTAPGAVHPYGAGHLKDFSANDGAWAVGKGGYLTYVSVSRLAATGGFDPTLLGVPASSAIIVSATQKMPVRSQYWTTTGPHRPNGSLLGLVAYTSDAPGIVNPPLLLKLPAPYSGYITCISLGKVCDLTLELGQGQVTMSLPPPALPNWRALADGLTRAMQRLES